MNFIRTLLPDAQPVAAFDMAVIDDVAADFRAIDVAEENARIAEIEAQIADAHKAIEAAESRCSEIAREKQRNGPDGSGVADALLSGRSAMDAARQGPDREALEAERLALRSGIRDLLHRVEDHRAEVAMIEGEARRKVAEGANRLIASLMAEAAILSEQLASVYASAEAVAVSTRFGSYEAGNLREIVRTATSSGGPMQSRRRIDVPTPIVDALKALEGKGRALRITAVTSASL
jgi:hypothetical protein